MSSNSNQTPNWILYVGGIASIATIIGVFIAYASYMHPTGGTGATSVYVNSNTNPGGSGGSSANNSQPTPTPSPTWNVILNTTTNSLTVNHYTVQDRQGHHFLTADASFANLTSTPQYLSGKLFDLKDENGQYYTEDQASNPGQTYAVDPGQSIHTYTSFVVPNSSCKFELSFVAGSSAVTQWTIHSNMCT